MKPDRSIWFPAKRYGWGWGAPVTWQGWTVIALYMLALIGLGKAFPPHTHPLGFFASITVATLLLIGVCWAKGERPSWRWGGR